MDSIKILNFIVFLYPFCIMLVLFGCFMDRLINRSKTLKRFNNKVDIVELCLKLSMIVCIVILGLTLYLLYIDIKYI